MTKKTQVIHIQQENNHAVCVAALRVLLSEGDGGWYAEGVEIDYAAFGKTPKEARGNFEKGFTRTITLHIKKFGDLSRFVRWAPQEVLVKLQSAKPFLVDTISMHDIEINANLPFDEIKYLHHQHAA